MSFRNCKIVCAGASPVDYHRQDVERGQKEFVMSSGNLREFAHCQRRWVKGYESPNSKSRRHGSLFDCRRLTPAQFNDRYAVQPATYETNGMQCPVCKGISDSQSCRTCKATRVPVKVTKDWTSQSDTCQAWVEAQKKAGKEVCTPDEVLNADAAIKRMEEDDILRRWHEACDTQVWIAGEWADEKSGLVVPVRCLLDYVARPDTEFQNCAGDLKTTRSGALRQWSSFCRASGYHIQAAWNLDLLNAAEGDPPGRPTWVFVLSENFPPWEPGRRLLPDALLMRGRKWYHHQMARYCHCLATGNWRGYDDHGGAIDGWTLIDEGDPRAELWEQEQASHEEQDDAADQESDEVPASEEGEIIP